MGGNFELWGSLKVADWYGSDYDLINNVIGWNKYKYVFIQIYDANGIPYRTPFIIPTALLENEMGKSYGARWYLSAVDIYFMVDSRLTFNKFRFGANTTFNNYTIKVYGSN